MDEKTLDAQTIAQKDEYGIRELQECTHEILAFLDKVCRENGFTYYLAYGTLLGAVRHNGFIPWDDDVDVWMPRDDYMKLLEYLRTENKDERFVLNDGDYKIKGDREPELQMRVLDLDADIERQYAGNQVTVHPWIDIFALDSFPEKKKKRYFRKFKRALFFYKVARCKNFVVKTDSFYGKVNKIMYTLHQKLKLFFFLSEKRSLKKVIKTITKYQGCESKEYFTYAAVYIYTPEKCFFPVEWFGTPGEEKFENGSFYVPSDCHNVLTKLYKDYMQLPPEEQRRPTHSAKLIRTQKDNT